MTALADLRTIVHLALSSKRGSTHGERLESFYAGQADEYDAFRKKLLHGREAAIEKLDLPENARVVDFGGGTGNNLDALNEKQIGQIAQWDLVDLCPSLLSVAEKKVSLKGFNFVRIHEADACIWESEQLADAVLFSYSATMIPDWLGAFENAYRILKPGGSVVVVDFYVARKFHTSEVRHGVFTRHFWPLWFSWDNVFMSQDHLPWLQSKFLTKELHESFGSLPYLPFVKVPYYYFVGEKPLTPN